MNDQIGPKFRNGLIPKFTKS